MWVISESDKASKAMPIPNIYIQNFTKTAGRFSPIIRTYVHFYGKSCKLVHK